MLPADLVSSVEYIARLSLLLNMILELSEGF